MSMNTHFYSENFQSTWFTKENFFRFILLALFVRVLLMPFFGHVDVLSEARRIYFWDISGVYFDDISRNATALFQLLFYKAFSVFIPHEAMAFAHADMANSTATPAEYFEFLGHPNIFRILFVIKIPFLVADLVTAWGIFALCGRTNAARAATVLWLFNPITLFAFYIFGRFESIPIMFCVLSMLAFQKKRVLLSALLLGLSINSREIFIFLGPAFLAVLFSSGSRDMSLSAKVWASIIVVFALSVSLQLISLTGGGSDSFGREVSSIATEGRVDYLFKFIVGSFLVFPMVYFATLLFAWNSEDESVALLPFVFSAVLFSFFVFSSHTAHYTSWMFAFVCLYLAKQPKILKPVLMLCVTWFFYNLAITDLGVFTTWLASPLSNHFSGLPHFPGLYNALGLNKALDLLTYGRIWSTFYRACLLYLFVQIALEFIKARRLNSVGETG